MVAEPMPPRTAPSDAFALTTPQRGLWIAEMLNPGDGANVTGQYSDIAGPLDAAIFERASRQVIEEAEALRLCVGCPVDQPLQWVEPLGAWSLPVVDLSAEPDPFAAALAWMTDRQAQPLDLAAGRAFRWTLLRLRAARFIWSFHVHHVLMDGFSRNAIWRRLDAVYSALAAGETAPPRTFGALRDTIAEVHDYERSASFVADRRYFSALLHDRPNRVTPAARTPAAARAFSQGFYRATVHLPRELTDSLRALVAGTGLVDVIAAAAALLPRGGAGGGDLLLGLAVSARRGALARRTPSMLSNVVPLRLHRADAMDIGELVSRTAQAIRDVLPHQRYPSQALRQDLRLPPIAPDAWGITVNFMPFDTGATFGGYAASTHNLSNGPVADLSVGVFDGPQQPQVRLDLNGNRDLYEEPELAGLLGRLVELLARMADGAVTRRIGVIAAAAAITGAGTSADTETPALPPSASPCPPGEERSYRRTRRLLPAALTARVNEFAAELGIDPLPIYLANYLALLRLYTRSDDQVIFAQVPMGDAVAAVAMRLQLRPADTFREAVADLARRWTEARAAPRGSAQTAGGSPFHFAFALRDPPAAADFQLLLQVAPAAALELEFQRGAVDREEADRMLLHFEALLDAATSQPDVAQARLDWIPAADRTQLAGWNSTAREYPRDRPLTALLEAQAARTPTAVAVEAGELRLTYAELFERAGVLAARLRRAGVRREVRVGIYLDRHPLLPEALLAILAAGGAYVPLDPALPRERLAFLVEDAQACVLVTRRALLRELPPHAAQVVCIDDDSPPPPGTPGWLPADAGSLAYVLYTSGSTGRPKGVAVEHRQLVNLLCSMAVSPGIAPGDALLAVTPLSFDIAGLEIWLPLLCGARICLAGRDEIRDPQSLRESLVRSRATIMQATPTVWRGLLATGWSGGAAFKALVGGDALPIDLAEMLAANCGEAWNLYGPTETTIWSSAWRLPRPAGRPRVGKPIANTQLHVLDAGLRQVAVGVPGELFIGGEGVSRGYLHRTELTAYRFVGDPFRGGSARLYRSGDLARWLPDGNLDLLGRDDEQLKVRGHRIEAGDVEAALHRLPGVAQAAVALRRPKDAEPRLVAYLVPELGATLASSDELRAQLRGSLAGYMLPYHFVHLAALPLTPNGKVDRRSLGDRSGDPGGAVPAPAGPADRAHAAPSPLEADLIARFGGALGMAATLDVDFFEAGGDSMGALKLISRLAQERGLDLSSGELFLHSTPRRMAARLEELVAGAARPRHWISLRDPPLRDGRGGGSIILVHPAGGDLAPYSRLAHHLGDAAALFGLQTAAALRYSSIEQRCGAYVEAVLAASCGTLTLVGYSLGGVLAIEMAEQLRRAGRAVARVWLLDAAVPRPAARGWAKVRHRVRELRRFSWRDRRIWFLEQFTRRWRTARAGVADEGAAAGLVDAREMQRLVEQALRWQPPPYAGEVRLLRAGRHRHGFSNPPGALGWDRHCAQLTVLDLPCDHAEILLEPQVRRVAAEIAAALGSGAATAADGREHNREPAVNPRWRSAGIARD